VPTLSEHINVYNTALSILYAKGFQLWFDQESSLYYAERDGWDFASESPVGLLGVVSIYELRHPTRYAEYWWRENVDLRRDLPKAPKPYVSVMKK
jgi:hypothetical protein